MDLGGTLHIEKVRAKAYVSGDSRVVTNVPSTSRILPGHCPRSGGCLVPINAVKLFLSGCFPWPYLCHWRCAGFCDCEMVQGLVLCDIWNECVFLSCNFVPGAWELFIYGWAISSVSSVMGIITTQFPNLFTITRNTSLLWERNLWR